MRVLDATEVANALPWSELIEALRAGFREGCCLPVRHHHRISVDGEPDATLLLMPAWRTGEVLGVKVATVFPGNRERGLGAVQASYLLSSARTGVPLALLDGLELTLRRTAAASALAADLLCRPEPESLLVVGTGNLAPHLARAHRAVRDYRAVSIWGRDPAKALDLAERLRSEGVPARATEDLEEAVRAADTISCATLAREPLVLGDWLNEGSHLDLVGGFTPEMREADDEAVMRSSIFVDTREGALTEAGDLIQPIERGLISAQDVRADLFELTRGEHPGRADAGEITLFKSVGTALEDLYAALLAWRSSSLQESSDA